MNRMGPFDAGSPAELCDKLRANDVRVPPRARDPATPAREIRVTCRFLAALSETDRLDYPLHVEHGDRPDLVLSLPSGRIGVEITEVVSETEARVAALSRREGIDPDFRYVPPCRPGEPRRSTDQIRDIARGRGPQRPHMGDSIECNWTEVMVYRTRDKAEKFAHPDFAKHERNWLLIHDDWNPVSGLDEHDVTKRLEETLFSHDWNNPFGRVFILRPQSVWEFSRGSDAVRHAIPDS